jgi:hypothetical protein
MQVLFAMVGSVACSSGAISTPTDGEAREMQGSPELRDASAFMGPWRLTGPRVDCRITLSPERVESANAHLFIDADKCLERMLGQAVAGWRPAPDGIDFAGSDRLSVGFFAFEGPTAVVLRPEGKMVLSRDQP